MIIKTPDGSKFKTTRSLSLSRCYRRRQSESEIESESDCNWELKQSGFQDFASLSALKYFQYYLFETKISTVVDACNTVIMVMLLQLNFSNQHTYIYDLYEIFRPCSYGFLAAQKNVTILWLLCADINVIMLSSQCADRAIIMSSYWLWWTHRPHMSSNYRVEPTVIKW